MSRNKSMLAGPQATNGTSGGVGMCETLWSGAFVYDVNNTGFEMNFAAGQANPNDAIEAATLPPEPCPDHNVTETALQAACGDVCTSQPL
jgi:hypothetical protein